MENIVDTRNAVEKRASILYPVMLIAAITVIVFSFAGIAAMMGWLPGAQSQIRLPERSEVPNRQPAVEGPRAAAPAQAAACANDCGVVESIRAVEVKGEGSGLGAIGGAVVGGILGNQVGHGNGRSAATVVGAGAGAYAGHEIEKNTRNSVSYQVRVRMSDGTTRTFHERAQPALAVGQRVRVTGQNVIATG